MTDNEGSDMTDPKKRKTSGPLTPRQAQMMDLQASGLRQTEIAQTMFISVQHVSAELGIIAAKLGARSPVGAVKSWSQAAAYREAAELLDSGTYENPEGSEKAVNAVLNGMAAILRDRAAKLLSP